MRYYIDYLFLTLLLVSALSCSKPIPPSNSRPAELVSNQAVGHTKGSGNESGKAQANNPSAAIPDQIRITGVILNPERNPLNGVDIWFGEKHGQAIEVQPVFSKGLFWAPGLGVTTDSAGRFVMEVNAEYAKNGKQYGLVTGFDYFKNKHGEALKKNGKLVVLKLPEKDKEVDLGEIILESKKSP